MASPYYQDDWVTIYHGDSREILPGLSYDAVVSDPPYGIAYNPDGSMPKSRAYEAVVGDDQPFDPTWLLDGRPTILWGANHYASRLPDAKGWLVWRKKAYYVTDLEFAWTNCVSKPAWIEHEWRGATRGVETGDHFHPTQKPLAVMRWCVDMVPPGVVADPYMGSGSTLKAAKALGRRSIGIEILERYCALAAERCAQEVLDFGGRDDPRTILRDLAGGTLMNEPTLFDVDRTTPTTCPVGYCAAIRFPDQDKVPTCACDLERASGDWVTRPAGCLNTYKPEHAEIPF